MSTSAANIVLVGPPGSGKTSVGRILAHSLGWQFFDIDLLIEERLGCTVQDYFSKFGEQKFRQEETKTLQNLIDTGLKGSVVATGGGIMTTSGNFELMSQMGAVICLKAKVDSLVDRLQDDRSRPLLAGKENSSSDVRAGLKVKLTELLRSRATVYSRPATTIATDGLTPVEVAKQIAYELKLLED